MPTLRACTTVLCTRLPGGPLLPSHEKPLHALLEKWPWGHNRIGWHLQLWHPAFTPPSPCLTPPMVQWAHSPSAAHRTVRARPSAPTPPPHRPPSLQRAHCSHTVLSSCRTVTSRHWGELLHAVSQEMLRPGQNSHPQVSKQPRRVLPCPAAHKAPPRLSSPRLGRQPGMPSLILAGLGTLPSPSSPPMRSCWAWADRKGCFPAV